MHIYLKSEPYSSQCFSKCCLHLGLDRPNFVIPLLEWRIRMIGRFTVVVLRTLGLLDNGSNGLVVGHGFCI